MTLLLQGPLSYAHSETSKPEKELDIHLSRELSPWRRNLIKEDLEFLKEVSDWKNFTEQDALATDIKSGDYPSLSTWLKERVSFLVPNSNEFVPFSYHNKERQLSYPNDQITPRNLNSLFLVQDQYANVIMGNIGTSYYLLGKQSNQSISLNVGKHFPKKENPRLFINSPRVGLIEVYPAFFQRRFSISGKGNKPADRILRLSFLFHEGRHSDGNGRSLGFFHTMCPPGHDYAGLYACDTPSNGAYKVSAVFLRNSLESCGQCSEANREALRLAYLDARNRILDRPILSPKEVEELNHLENQISALIPSLLAPRDKVSDEKKDQILTQMEALEQKIHELKNPDFMAKVYWNSAPEALK